MIRVKVLPPQGCDRSALDANCWVSVPEGTTVKDILKLIKCSPIKAKMLLVSVNSVKAPLGRPLHDGDVVGFFSLTSGG